MNHARGPAVFAEEFQALAKATPADTVIVDVRNADEVLLLTKRPTRVAEILDYGDARPRTTDTLSAPSFIEAKKRSLEIFQREVRR